jgi:hypothetical protein
MMEIMPDTADQSIAIRVDMSFDGGVTYGNVGTFRAYQALRWSAIPGDAQPTHLMIHRVSGTSDASEFVIGAQHAAD